MNFDLWRSWLEPRRDKSIYIYFTKEEHIVGTVKAFDDSSVEVQNTNGVSYLVTRHSVAYLRERQG